jgi:Uma2 family endonuclease
MHMEPTFYDGQARAARDAVIAALYDAPCKAEIIRGEIVRMRPEGCAHARATLAIAASLLAYTRRTGRGMAFGGGAFLVDLPDRWSFCPDAAFHVGPDTGYAFLDRAPVFAVEVRGASDYGLSAERMMATKRREYFAAGTEVVWDVDVRKSLVRAFRADAPEWPIVYRRGEMASAEPTVPGWTMPVDEIFESGAQSPGPS